MSERGRRWLLRGAQALLAAAIIYFVYRSISTQLAKSRFLELHFSPVYLVVSWLVITAYYLLFAGGFMLVVRSLGYRLRYRDAFKLSFAANLGKYLPGGVWQVAGKVAMAKQAGIERHGALVATVVESAVSVIAGLLVFTSTTLLGAPFPAGLPEWPLPLIIVAILVGLHPALFRRVVAFGMRVLKIEGDPPHLRLGAIAALVAYYSAIWFVAGGAFWLFTRSLVADPGAGWPAYTGYYAAAVVGGLLVLFAPSGLGVRESFLVLLLRDVIPGGSASAWVVVLAARVWSSASELALSSVAVARPFSPTDEAAGQAADEAPEEGFGASGEADGASGTASGATRDREEDPLPVTERRP